MPLDDLQFLHHAHVPQCTATVDKHFIGYCSLQLMTRGHLRLSYDDRRYDLRDAWFWPAYPGPLIRFRCVDPADSWEHRYCAFTGSRVRDWHAAGIWPDAPQILSDPDLVPAFDQLLALLDRNDHWSRLRAITRLEDILLRLAAGRARPQRQPWLQEVLRLLENCLEGLPDLTPLADRLGWTTVHLRRRFRAAMGCSPRDYVQGRRMARARDLLMDERLSLAAIAERLGYADVAQFNRQFRRQVGLPPGRYRASRQL